MDRLFLEHRLTIKNQGPKEKKGLRARAQETVNAKKEGVRPKWDGKRMNGERTVSSYSLRELYEEYMPSVYRAAFHCVQNHSRAETIVRDSFLDLAGSSLRFRNKRQIRGFLILTAVKRCEEWPDCDSQGRKRQEI